jgi:hypothetical protein
MKSVVVDALQQVFNSTERNPNFQNLRVSIEYPLDQQSYPSVWVNYDDTDSLQIAGIGHQEFVLDAAGGMHEVTRWLFAGTVTLTVVALSSLERDGLYDELVRIFAFSRIQQETPEFRGLLESNDFIALGVNWDELRPHGDAAAPGTPWGTEDEVIYEKSIGFDVQGEFVSDWRTNDLVSLREIVVVGQAVDESGDDLDIDPLVLSMPHPE